MSKSVYEIVTDEIIKKLESGVVPWRQPWRSFGSARNLISGKPYRGINAFLLNVNAHQSPFYLTYKQADSLGGNIRKGEKSSIAVFWKGDWKVKRENPETGNIEETSIHAPVLRFYHVFNSDQCEGISHKRLMELQNSLDLNEFTPIEQAEKVIAEMPKKPEIKHAGCRAFYRPSSDEVTLPEPGLFDSPEAYYSVAFHELTHSTGHGSRIGRKGIIDVHAFGDAVYAQEELVAEMGAAFLCGECRLAPSTVDNAASYIHEWLKVLRNDSKMVVFGAGQAQKAADFILGKKAEAEG